MPRKHYGLLVERTLAREILEECGNRGVSVDAFVAEAGPDIVARTNGGHRKHAMVALSAWIEEPLSADLEEARHGNMPWFRVAADQVLRERLARLRQDSRIEVLVR